MFFVLFGIFAITNICLSAYDYYAFERLGYSVNNFYLRMPEHCSKKIYDDMHFETPASEAIYDDRLFKTPQKEYEDFHAVVNAYKDLHSAKEYTDENIFDFFRALPTDVSNQLYYCGKCCVYPEDARMIRDICDYYEVMKHAPKPEGFAENLTILEELAGASCSGKVSERHNNLQRFAVVVVKVSILVSTILYEQGEGNRSKFLTLTLSDGLVRISQCGHGGSVYPFDKIAPAVLRLCNAFMKLDSMGSIINALLTRPASTFEEQ